MIRNLHVVDLGNVGDLYSSPLRYFDFPGHICQTNDLRYLKPQEIQNTHLIVGGGGILFDRFLAAFKEISAAPTQGARILWGAGSQRYGTDLATISSPFDYSEYLSKFDLIGLRDNNTPYDWVPCVSCMHPAFDKSRTPQHEFVVFSHKKYRIDIPNIPTLSNEESDFEKVLDFLGSGEIILTSSFHGAYWGTLLGRRVLAFPFSSKFFTLKHSPAFYPVEKWSRSQFKFSLFGKVLHASYYEDKKFSCQTQNWMQYAHKSPAYPDALENCRAQNRWFYQQVMNTLND